MKLKDRKSAAKALFALPAGPLLLADLSAVSFIPTGMTKAYRNNRYTVMVFENTLTSGGPAIKIMIQRLDNQPIPGHWREIQNIKNQLFGKETTGIEYYPAESQLLDTHNIYWLWIFPAGVIPIYIIR